VAGDSGISSGVLSIEMPYVTSESNRSSFPRRWARVCILLTGLAAGVMGWATQPPDPTSPAAAATSSVQAAPDNNVSPKTPGETLRRFTLKIDGQTLQLELKSMDIDAQTIESEPKRKTFRGDVRLQLQLSRAPVPERAPAGGPEQGGAADGPTLILQAEAVDLTQPPLHLSVRPGGGCSVTLQDHAGRQLWKLTGAKCSLQSVGPPAVIQTDDH